MEFLLENPFVLVVIIGIISSVYKNLKAQEGEDKQSRKQPKPFMPGQPDNKKPLFDLGDWQKQIEQKMEQVKPRLEPVKEEAPVKEAKIESEVKELPNQLTQKERRSERISTGRLNQPRKIEPSPSVQPLVTNHTLKEAVVWAEILGPPRAKRSYFRGKAGQ